MLNRGGGGGSHGYASDAYHTNHVGTWYLNYLKYTY